jgi:hypothetical protein
MSGSVEISACETTVQNSHLAWIKAREQNIQKEGNFNTDGQVASHSPAARDLRR